MNNDDLEDDFMYKILFDTYSKKGKLKKGIYPQFISNVFLYLFGQSLSLFLIILSYQKDNLLIKNIYQNMYRISIFNLSFLNICESIFQLYLYYINKNKSKIITNYTSFTNINLIQFLLVIIFFSDFDVSLKVNQEFAIGALAPNHLSGSSVELSTKDDEYFYFHIALNIYRFSIISIILVNTYEYYIKIIKNILT
jgi:hypothetical protein